MFYSPSEVLIKRTMKQGLSLKTSRLGAEGREIDGRGCYWLKRYTKLGDILATKYDNRSPSASLRGFERQLSPHQLELEPLRCSRNGGLRCRDPENNGVRDEQLGEGDDIGCLRWTRSMDSGNQCETCRHLDPSGWWRRFIQFDADLRHQSRPFPSPSLHS